MLWRLFWVGVVRPVGKSCKVNDVISCNRIAVQDVETKPISRHHFELQKEVKDAGISDIMERIYQLDFMEPRTELKYLMTNKFKKNQVVKVGNHYETALPLRNSEMTLQNKIMMSEKRAHYLKEKFQKDEQNFNCYKGFINEIIENVYAILSDRTPVDGRLWYLPYHGIYHYAKPKNICVVFDRSAEYAGRSVNQELLVLPDLTN